MAVLPIRLAPDPVLLQKAKRVSHVDDSLRKLIVNMVDTVHAAPGVGLAAPQVGVPLRVVVIAMPEEKDLVLINPSIVKRGGQRRVDEGCLSIPGYIGEIQRSETVTAKAQDRKGKEIRIKAEGLLAQVLEHEIDHLNGVLYVTHLENQDKLRKIQPAESKL